MAVMNNPFRSALRSAAIVASLSVVAATVVAGCGGRIADDTPLGRTQPGTAKAGAPRAASADDATAEEPVEPPLLLAIPDGSYSSCKGNGFVENYQNPSGPSSGNWEMDVGGLAFELAPTGGVQVTYSTTGSRVTASTLQLTSRTETTAVIDGGQRVTLPGLLGEGPLTVEVDRGVVAWVGSLIYLAFDAPFDARSRITYFVACDAPGLKLPAPPTSKDPSGLVGAFEGVAWGHDSQTNQLQSPILVDSKGGKLSATTWMDSLDFVTTNSTTAALAPAQTFMLGGTYCSATSDPILLENTAGVMVLDQDTLFLFINGEHDSHKPTPRPDLRCRARTSAMAVGKRR